ncbi:carboxypeptidase-like regulatory domain-containing protein [Fulvivirga ulvae]|uniref:carboxypeptidase-like regulatory domain-containing protein n=1 Tax=Fulvivirga ulvae TaxID=2904245 RepID=UPI001F1FDA44|nr:carboxypeptidase-like regulatory domain-containing protein [Fulvivirga ulvae]UII30447.1 carboxypeptidase-like regulatory domain-containing protein [Fulvivirga ulvae]
MISLKPFYHIINLLVLLVLTGCDCQYEISGVVLDEVTNMPVPYVAIGRTDAGDADTPFNRKTFTEKQGEFVFNGVTGSCDEATLYFSHQDYITEKVTLPNSSTDTIYLRPIQKTSIFFDKQREYKVKKLMKKNNSPSSMNDTTICQEWDLTEKQIRIIIGKAKEIDGSQWHYQFDHLPCRVTGKLVQSDMEYDLSVNSGAWLTITSPDTTIMYGIFNEQTYAYFMSTAWTEDLEPDEHSE